MVERPLMVRWVFGSILRDGTLLNISRSYKCCSTGVTKTVACAVLSVAGCT